MPPFDTFKCYLHGFNGAVFVEIHAVDAGLAVMSVGSIQWSPVVDNVPIVAMGYFHDRMMACASCYCGILLQYLPDTFEWTQG